MKRFFFFFLIITIIIFFLINKNKFIKEKKVNSLTQSDNLSMFIDDINKNNNEEKEEKLLASVTTDVLIKNDNTSLPSDYSNKENIILSVPFVVQAPLSNWQDERQQDACEEAGALMAMAWVKGETKINFKTAEKEIIALADWQQQKYGEHRDVYIDDVATHIFKDYFHYDRVKTVIINEVNDLVSFLKEGKLILAPTNGQALNNPHFRQPGPERHLVVIIGYDVYKDEFITNDPGTRYGASYRYPANLLFQAIRTYPTGYKLAINGLEKKVLLVEK